MKPIRRSAVIAAVLAGVLTAGAACSSDDSGSGDSGQITLTVDTFGSFGYEDLFAQYEKDHAGIKIEHRNEKEHEKVYVPNLLKYLETGSGAGWSAPSHPERSEGAVPGGMLPSLRSG